MTDPIPAYEPSGPLTVCPCCGEPPAPEDAHDTSKSCERCWRLVGHIAYLAGTRATMAAEGVRLRREGKLPPLKEPERWGVWADAAGGWTQHVRTSEVPCSCDVPHPGSFHEMRGTRAEAEAFATYARRYGRSYTVRPYPDAKQTSESAATDPVMPGDSLVPEQSRPKTRTAPPLPQTSTQAVAAEGGAAKVDPYAAHRLAGERRVKELTTKRIAAARKVSDAKSWLTEATERLAAIDRELDRLDRTGEVK